ncbi:MAG: M28 family peptidase [Luteolibacter sp.]
MKIRLMLSAMVMAAVVAGALILRDGPGSGALGRDAHAQTAAILAFGPRPPGSEALDKVRAHVRAELEAAGWVTAGQEFEQRAPIGRVRFGNVRARFPSAGGDVWGKRVDGLLTAHIDSKYYKDRHFVGADDAASACAAIVVIARHIARRNPDLAGRLELVFFDGEEAFQEHMTPQDGLYGSRHYASHWRGRDDMPRFGVLLDMVGHKDLRIALPSDTPPSLKAAVFAAAKAERVERHFGMAAGPIIDDHVPLNLVGIPTVNLIGDFTRFRWWHTPNDNLDLISPESLDISIRVSLRLLEDLGTRVEPHE